MQFSFSAVIQIREFKKVLEELGALEMFLDSLMAWLHLTIMMSLKEAF